MTTAMNYINDEIPNSPAEEVIFSQDSRCQNYRRRLVTRNHHSMD